MKARTPAPEPTEVDQRRAPLEGFEEIHGLRAAKVILRGARAKLTGFVEIVQRAEAELASAEQQHAALLERVTKGEQVGPKEARAIDDTMRDAAATQKLYAAAVEKAEEEVARAAEAELTIRHGAWQQRLMEHRKVVDEADKRVKEATEERERIAARVSSLAAQGISGDPAFAAHIAWHEEPN